MPRDQYTFGHTTEFRREDNGQGTVMLHKVQARGTVTMGELAQELERLGAPAEVYVASAAITWEAEASLEALQNREAQRRSGIESTRRWEIATLQRLQEKYPEITA